jgi:hypothetical protein
MDDVMKMLRYQPTLAPNQMDDWKQICKAFAKKINASLVFVNETSCGVQYQNGSFGHIYIDEMVEYLQQLDKQCVACN